MAPGRISLPNTPVKDTKVNGVDGINGSPASITSSPTAYRTTSYSFRSTSKNGGVDASVTYLINDTARALEKKGSSELGFGVFETISDTSFIKLVEYIGNERLSSLPHKGSKWDKVLIRALYFAERQHGFEKMMKNFGADDNAAANLAYGYCKLLLELGHENADALEKAFAVLYKHALEVAALLHRAEILTTTGQIREQLCLMYGDLLTLTSVVATRFYKAAQGTASSKMSVDIYETCGDIIDSFRDRQTKVADFIWINQASISGIDLDRKVSPKTLKRWLTPTDPVQLALTQDHTVQLAGQAEFTCLWFQKPLSTFTQGDGRVMAVTGQPGSGKSVLAASIAERLQRALGRRNFSTLFYTINSEIPAAATIISVLKSLLSQIFNLRLGNIQTYHAVARAYENCAACTDLKRYENHLWDALDEAFKKPLENARDLIVVVDGLDEIQGGKAAAQAFFERLADVVCEGKRVKLIGLAESLSMPSGINTTHLNVTSDSVHDDIHSVLLRNLMRTRSLHSQGGPEQEQILERLAKASNGSFVWAILVSELLADTKTSEDFMKTLDEFEKSKPSASDLVQRLALKRDLPATTRTILGWMMSAERPLSVLDIQNLLAAGKAAPESESDINTILRPLESLLVFSDNIVRFKHHQIHSSVSGLVDSGKISIPSETKGGDLVLRALSYAKAVLKDSPDPTLEEYDLEKVERTFREHPLLPYVLRYWVVHVQRLGTSKYPKDLGNVLPTTAILSMIERTVWTHELPLFQTLELHKIASQVRQTNLKPPSPAFLQTTIDTAIIYDLLGRPSEAAPFYYFSTKISHDLLLEQLTIELGQRFLRASDGLTEPKRTETMTRREEIYKVLITLFERQYGSSSEQVIHIRTMLAHFYEHIHEVQSAAAIYEIVHGAQTHLHGRDSSQARGVSDHLKVMLGRSKSQEQIVTRKESIFDEEDEVESEEVLDVTRVSQLLQAAKTERAFVELWQRISTICRSSTSIELHEKNIEVATAYSRFLVNQKRSEEASAVLCSLTREYERNSVSFSDRIVSRLSETASFLRELGQYSAALSILRSISEIYQSLKREESYQSVEIHQQISIVETELIETSSAHGDTLERIFRSAIKNEKPVDAKLLTIARTLASQYMEHYQPANAIEIINLLLARVWPSFLSGSVHSVEMTTAFPKETISLILEILVPCHTQLWQQEKVERTLSTLFNAGLTAKSVDFALVNKVQALLIEHYDNHHHPEKSVLTLQKALPVRRSNLGTTHDDTIKTLYDLGRRSRERPRAYPGWIDFYQQIVSYLNKDSETCHPKALDAIIIVATTYWEDGRYDAAVHNYNILWNTFVKKPKEHPQFAKEEFAEQLYERYYRCLEYTSVRQETLYEVTEQYRSTCVTIFGAQSEITIRATLALARISYYSEKHSSRAVDLYEEVSKHSHGTGVHKFEVQSALSTLYTHQIIMQSSTSISSETIEKARFQSYQSYEQSVSKFGYSHQSTLSRLHQVALLYYKQNKTEALTKELTKAMTEIITKETSSIKLIEAAESIIQTFKSTSTTEYCQKLISELHRQIVWKDASRSASFGFDLTKYGRSSLPFLAAMIYKISTDVNVSFAQIMADLTTEMLYFEDYRKIVRSNGSLQDILTTASALRAFLLKVKRNDAVEALDEEVASIFVSRDGSKMKLLSQSSAKILMVAIMQYIGEHRRSSFIKAVVLASNARLAKLMSAEQYPEAYDIANCAFEFALENEGYNGPKGIGHGFSLASNLAGVGYSKKCNDASLRRQMLQLSNSIAKKILDVCKQQKINLTEIQLRELNRLVELLGVQEDYETLEWLLTSLWGTREAHRDWSPATLHNLGRQLVCARYLAGHPIKALRLCEDITYNLRRTHGATHPITRDMNVLLAQLYSSCGNYYLQHGSKDKNNTDLANQYFAKALSVHEEMLRLLVNNENADGAMDDDDDWDSTGAILAEHGITLKLQANGHGQADGIVDEPAVAKTHLRLLKLAYQRLGSWPRPHDEYEKLVGQVQSTFTTTKDIQTPEKWQVKGYGSGKAESTEGTFEKVENWKLMDV